ncbi:hypothetical protein C1280_11905 [Gemmata obscuriglobus]|uniref:Uncharacterized protein n=1 Tax=Gemmata obscuriglobus TaxID=114 RepID=A0A2Z3GTA6_9BACT|nr:hypothetical protein C1280_11905 [Gemmata obscuriglobus]
MDRIAHPVMAVQVSCSFGNRGSARCGGGSVSSACSPWPRCCWPAGAWPGSSRSTGISTRSTTAHSARRRGRPPTSGGGGRWPVTPSATCPLGRPKSVCGNCWARASHRRVTRGGRWTGTAFDWTTRRRGCTGWDAGAASAHTASTTPSCTFTSARMVGSWRPRSTAGSWGLRRCRTRRCT